MPSFSSWAFQSDASPVTHSPPAAEIVATSQKDDTCHEVSDVHGSATSREDSRGPVVATVVKAILHIPDEDARPSVRLTFVDEDDGTEMSQPLLYTNAIPLRRNRNGYTVLATACGRYERTSECLILPSINVFSEAGCFF